MIGFAYAMIVPPFLGQEVIRSAGQIADEKGYVKVRDTYLADGFDNIYAARNTAARIHGEPPRPHEAFGDMPAVCVMDAGNNGVIILADKMLPPRKHGVLILDRRPTP